MESYAEFHAKREKNPSDFFDIRQVERKAEGSPPSLPSLRRDALKRLAAGEFEPVYQILVPFPVDKRHPSNSLGWRPNQTAIRHFARFVDMSASSEARDADGSRIPKVRTNLQGALRKLARLRPILQHVKADRQLSQEVKGEGVARVETDREKKRLDPLFRLAAKNIAAAEAAVSGCKAGMKIDGLAEMPARLLGLLHHHQRQADQKVGPGVARVEDSGFSRQSFARAKSAPVCLLRPDIPEMPPRELNARFGGAGIAAQRFLQERPRRRGVLPGQSIKMPNASADKLPGMEVFGFACPKPGDFGAFDLGLQNADNARDDFMLRVKQFAAFGLVFLAPKIAAGPCVVEGDDERHFVAGAARFPSRGKLRRVRARSRPDRDPGS